jgi:uncharacterized membrane protein YGL010W
MKSLSQWFADYAVCHQNETNKSIHYICVPAIFLSLVGLIMSIPSGILSSSIPFQSPIFINWASVLLIFLLVFYFRLSIKLGFQMLLFSMACLVINFFIGQFLPLWLFSIAVFVIAWIGQFYGHKIEGKKPSFFNDLQFLLIGPAWVIDNLMSKLK